MFYTDIHWKQDKKKPYRSENPNSGYSIQKATMKRAAG